MKKVKILKVFPITENIGQLTSWIEYFLINTEYRIELSDLNSCDFILFGELTGGKNPIDDEKFIKWIYKNKHFKNMLTKNILSINFQEALPEELLEDRLKVLKKELNIDESQVFHVDAVLTNFRSFNDIPLEFKLRQFFYGIDIELNNLENIFYANRLKKITFLTNKINLHRLQIFDKVVHLYNDINKFKIENNVSMLNAHLMEPHKISIIKLIEKNKNYLNYDKNFYNNLNLPWYIDNPSHPGDVVKVQTNTFNLHKTSVFSLVSETVDGLTNRNEPYEIINFNQPNYKFLRVSEKSIIPLIVGSLPYYITDFIYYRMYEKLGFNFGYLWDLFGIEYRTNTEYQNYQNLNKFIPIIKELTIEELNSIKIKYKDYIDNNFEVIKKLLFGGVTLNEEVFINTLTKKYQRN